VAQLEALILEYAAGDQVVIIGRGSPFLLGAVAFLLADTAGGAARDAD